MVFEALNIFHQQYGKRIRRYGFGKVEDDNVHLGLSKARSSYHVNNFFFLSMGHKGLYGA